MLPLEPARLSRRRLLVGSVGVPLLFSASACTDNAPADLPPDPDREAFEAAYEVEVATLAALQGWTVDAADSAISPLEARDVISAHVSALAEALSTTPPDTGSPSGSPSAELVPNLSTGQVVALLDTATTDHTRALRSASPEISPLLASIAASDAALAAAIRRSS